MNLANKLTTFRVLCIPIFVVFMLIESIPYNYYLAAIVFIVASITDLFDGKIARKYHLVTNFGKFMDPLDVYKRQVVLYMQIWLLQLVILMQKK